ncbi:MAG TPA: ATP synthase F1 subunit gamma [Terriglobales bacterium]|nr:ATP synthase F1 subunit gamma [Terriglobales bacterium]
MATLRDIQRRIRSVQSTQKITKAMKLVAASKFRRAQERILEARPYATKMGELVDGLVARTAGEETHPLLAARSTGRKRLVVITADKGLCGAFNSNVLRESLRFIRDAAEVSVTLVVVGKKARDFYRRRQFTVKSEMLGVFDKLAYSHAQELADGLMQDFLADEVDEVQLMYNEFRSVAVQHPVRRQLLPLGASEAGEDDADDGPQEEYIYEPSPEAILASLLPRHVTTQVYRALMESAAGEFGARMTAMEAASKNAREMINLLTIQYNKARQERITKELLDIVGGAEALRQSVEA